LAVAAPYRLERLTSFTDPFAHAQGSGLQTVQGLYALASGGIFGVGLGGSTSKYSWLPNANTDFVFAVIGEETGLIGCIVVLALFMLFAFTGLRISRLSPDPFVRLVAGGATVWICGQAVINVGYVIGLLPVTGIPLPFISAGGTSLLATSLVFGMLVSFARHEPAAANQAQLAANAGQRGPVQRWCRIPVPKGYIAPKRAATRRPSAPARVAQPVARAGQPPARRTAARPAAPTGRRASAPPARRPVASSSRSYRPTGTDGPPRR
jgi:cell division protein FtsW